MTDDANARLDNTGRLFTDVNPGFGDAKALSTDVNPRFADANPRFNIVGRGRWQ